LILYVAVFAFEPIVRLSCLKLNPLWQVTLHPVNISPALFLEPSQPSN